MRNHLLLAGFLACTTACGSSASDPTIDDICNADDGIFPELFEKVFACFPEFAIILGGFPDAAELSDACEADIGAHLDDGTTLLGDADALAACREFIDNFDCETQSIDAPNPCEDLAIGTLPEDADCDSDDQCMGNSYCDQSGTGTCGVCAPRKANGENCFDDEECIGGRCSGATSTTQGMCIDYGEVGADCADDDDCVGTLECNANTDKCQTRQVWAVDDDCSDIGEDCGFPTGDLYCDTVAGKCAEFAALGGDCVPINPLVGFTMLCDLLRFEMCDPVTSKCVAPTVVAINEDCSALDGTVCQDGLICSDLFEDGTCQQPPNVGDSCLDADDCSFIMECVNGECQYGSSTGMCPAPAAS